MKKIFFLVFLLGLKAYSFLDSVIDSGKDVAKAAAVIGSLEALLEESGGAVKQVKDLNQLKNELNKVNSEIDKISGLNEDTKRALKGAGLQDAADLEDGINKTRRYLQTVKKILMTVGALSPETQTAINSSATNQILGQMLEKQNDEAIRKEKEEAKDKAERVKEVKKFQRNLNRSMFGED